ncbi:hypothetical protein AN619_10030 [Thermotalea metallivorans]|uniref:Uncharacterized protein n=1 Tax=Thermotalea metallivorans TaxID=520762 RepID=A0A140L7E7_9FIRM|nr:hypothetical protein AN619_10030 [Thermotalea metallivorans]
MENKNRQENEFPYLEKSKGIHEDEYLCFFIMYIVKEAF